jgi:LmbE family N-acetylglucosaminyl deacetylase
MDPGALQAPDALDEPDRLLKDLSGPHAAIRASHVAIVIAHPDDETIGCGGQMARLAGACLVLVTDGACRTPGESMAHGFSSARDYASARRHELYSALALAGMPAAAVHSLGLPDQQAALRLTYVARRLAALFVRRRISVALTHAYEGGHPDHDATAFAVHAASALLHRLGQRLATLEMPFYHAGETGWVVQRFIRMHHRPELVLRFGRKEQARKERMLAAHATQQAVLAMFSARQERFRVAPRYDFRTLPNRGHLLYEQYAWGMTGEQWIRLVGAAIDELRLGDTPWP